MDVAIQFQCQGCGNPFTVAEQMAGQMAQCNRCGTVVTVPYPSATPQAYHQAPGYPVQGGYSAQTPTQAAPLVPTGHAPQYAAYPGMQPAMPYPGAGQTMPGAPYSPNLPPAKPAASSGVLLPVAIGGGVAAAILVLGGILFFVFGGSSNDVATVAESPTQSAANVAVSPSAPPPMDPPPIAPASSSQATNSNPPSNQAPSLPTASPADNGASAPSVPPVVASAPSKGGLENTTASAASFVPGSKPTVPLRVQLGGKHVSYALQSDDEDAWEKAFNPQRGKLEEKDALFPWTAKADPVPAPLEYKKGKITSSYPKDLSYKLELPTGPSNFVFAHASHSRQHSLVAVDLRTGKAIGKPVLINEFDRQPKFSPDGRYLAIKPPARTAVKIYSFATGGLAQELLAPEGETLRSFTFAGPHQFLGLAWDHQWGNRLYLWDIKTGAVRLQVELPDRKRSWMRDDTLTVSPGGKYAVFVSNNRLDVVDLETGQAAGQTPLGDELSDSYGTAFSADGNLFAMIGRFSRIGERLVVVDMNDGTLKTNTRSNSWFGFGGGGPALRFLPQGELLLFKNATLLDPESGRAVWELDNPHRQTVMMLRMTDALVMVKDGKQPGLQTVSLPTQIPNALEQVRKGGAATDVSLPPFTVVKVERDTKKTLPTGATSWNYQPTPSEAGFSGKIRDVEVAGTGDRLRAAMFAGPKLQQIVLHRESKTTVSGHPVHRFLVERIDLATGDKTAAMPIPDRYALIDVSRSGNFAAIAFTDTDRGVTRVDILGLEPRKHVLGFRPYADEAAEAEMRLKAKGGESPGEIKTIEFINDERLITISPTGKLVLWNVATGEALYHYEQFGRVLAFSPTRGHFIALHKGNFRIFNSLTGEVAGSLETPYSGLFCRGAAFRADGAEFCALMDAGNDKIMVRWNMTTGQVEQEFPIHADAVPAKLNNQPPDWNLAYRDSDHLLLASGCLINLPRRAIVWRYANLQDSTVLGNRDAWSWHWFRQANGGLQLSREEMPSRQVLASAANVKLEDQLLLYPGGAAKLDVDLSSVGLQGYQPVAREAIEQSLAQRGIGLHAEGVPLTLRASENSTGNKLAVAKTSSRFDKPLPGQAPDQIIEQKQLLSHFAILDSSGKPAWSQTVICPMRTSGRVAGNDVEAALRKEMYEGFTSMLSAKRMSLGIPTYIFKPLTSILAGESEFHQGVERKPSTSDQPPSQPARSGSDQPFISNPFGGAATP
jgi:hypothetical protein